MAVLGSTFPNSDIQKGSFLNTAGATTGDYFALVDEVVASANDADYIRGPSGAAATGGTQVYDAGITNMPTDFVDMTSLSYNIRYRQFSRVDDTLGLTLLVESSGGTAYTNTVTIAGITTTAFTSSGVTAFTLTSAGLAATKADWDAAVLVVGQTYTASMGNDNAYVAISAIEITGVYDAASTVTRTATGSGTGSSSATGIIPKVRTASASGTGTSSASRVVSKLRTASASGAGTSSANRLVTRVRTSSASGTGTSSVNRLVTRIRTASASGVGSSDARIPLKSTVSSSGLGSSSCIRVVVRERTASATGLSSSSIVYLRFLVRTTQAFADGTSFALGARASVRSASSAGFGTVEKALWANAGKPISGFIVIRQKNSVGFSKNDPRDQRMFFKRQ